MFETHRIGTYYGLLSMWTSYLHVYSTIGFVNWLENTWLLVTNALPEDDCNVSVHLFVGEYFRSCIRTSKARNACNVLSTLKLDKFGMNRGRHKIFLSYCFLSIPASQRTINVIRIHARTVEHVKFYHWTHTTAFVWRDGLDATVNRVTIKMI